MATANSTIDQTSDIYFGYIINELEQNPDEAVLYLQFKDYCYAFGGYPDTRKLDDASPLPLLTSDQIQKFKTFFTFLEEGAQSSQTARGSEIKGKSAVQRYNKKPAPLPDFTCPNRNYKPHGTQYNQTHANSIDKIKRCGTVKAINQIIINTHSECEKNAAPCDSSTYHSILHKCSELLSKKGNKDFNISLKELIRLNPLRERAAASVCMLLLNICAKTHNSSYVLKLFFGDQNSPGLMEEWEVTPDVRIYCSAIKACASIKNKQLFNRLFQAMSEAIAKGILDGNEIMCVKLLQYYLAVIDTEAAEAVRELLFGRDGKPSLMSKWGIEANIMIYSAAITFCTRTIDKELFQQVYETALKKITAGIIGADFHFCGALAHYYSKTGDTDAYRGVVLTDKETESLIRRWRVKLNINVINIGFSLCADTQDKILFNDLHSLMTAGINDAVIEANHITCVNMLGYCESVKNDIITEKLVLGCDGKKSLMSQWGVGRTHQIYGAAFKVCAATLNYQLFDGIFKQMLDNKVRLERGAIVSLLNYYLAAKYDKATEALMLGSRGANSLISQWGQQDETPIYSAAIKVCTATLNRRLFEEIYQIIRRKITERKFTANEMMCVNLLVYFAAVKDAAAAAELLIDVKGDSLMKQWGIPPNIRIYCAGITVCAETQNKPLFTALYKSILYNIENQLMTANVHLCTHLLSYFASVNDYRAAYQVLFSYEACDFTKFNDSEFRSSSKDVTYTVKESSAPAPLSEAPSQTHAINSAVSLIKRWNVTPDAILLDGAISAYNKLRRPEQVTQALKVLIIERNIKPEPSSFIHLLEHYSQEGNISAAETLFFDKITRITDTPEGIAVLPADIRKPVSDRDYNRERDANLNRLSAKNYAPVFDDTTAADSPGLMSERAAKKPVLHYTIAWDIIYDEISCIAFLTFCFKNKQAELAKKMMEMYGRYNITITPVMQALFAVQEPGDFKAQLLRGINNNIFRENLGLTGGALNFHISAVFRDIKKSEETALGLPFEFAKQLWFYHLEKGEKITALITGYHGSTKLRQQLLELADGNGFQIFIDPDNPGRLIIPPRVIWGSNHMKLTSDVLKSISDSGNS